MSRTDHHGNTSARIQTQESRPRWQRGMTDREAIAEALADHLRLDLPVSIRSARRYVEPYRGLQTDFVAQPYTLGQTAKARYSNGVPMATCGLAEWECSLLHSWREALLSDCDYGCKVYQRIHDGVRETQVQHMSAYGCKDTDEPIERHETVRTRQAVPPMIRRYMPTTRPVTTTFTRKELSSRTNGVVMTEAPSLMQMARARQAQLNGGR